MSKKTRELEVQEVDVSEEKITETSEGKIYSKEQLVKSQKFRHISDIVRSVVGEEEQVTIEEVEKRVEVFLTMEVR